MTHKMPVSVDKLSDDKTFRNRNDEIYGAVYGCRGV